MSEQEAGAARRTPPVDPRLLKHASASRGFFVAIAGGFCAYTALTAAAICRVREPAAPRMT